MTRTSTEDVKIQKVCGDLSIFALCDNLLLLANCRWANWLYCQIQRSRDLLAISEISDIGAETGFFLSHGISGAAE